MKTRNRVKVCFFSRVITLFFSILSFRSKKVTINHHNGESIFEYPEKEWSLVPFPNQKGNPYVADNLATVNRHVFTSDKKFKDSKFVAESRWQSSKLPRDISWRLNVFLWAFGQNLRHKDIKDSIFVECGTGKGYMAAGACNYFKFDDQSPYFYLIDRYEKSAVSFTRSSKNKARSFDTLGAYTSNTNEVKEYFSKYPTVKIIKGLIPEILEEVDFKPILFLHIDLNAHEPEKAALEILIKKFVTGTVILFDDYGGPGGELQAIEHEEFALNNNKEILTLPTGQAIIVW